MVQGIMDQGIDPQKDLEDQFKKWYAVETGWVSIFFTHASFHTVRFS